MIEVHGKYNTAKVFTDSAEDEAIAQIRRLLDQAFTAGSRIRIMPDTHAGAGCTIGTTMTIRDAIVPNLVGVDIGCGMETVRLAQEEVDLARLDATIHEHVPAGFETRAERHAMMGGVDLRGLRCAHAVNLARAELSLGTLGGGNHFIELDRDEEGRLYLVVHTGSRYLGKQVAEHYQAQAAKACDGARVQALVAELKAQGREREIEAERSKWKRENAADRDLAFVRGDLFDDYLHDMSIVQRYAALNRQAIVEEIASRMGLKAEERFTTTHNYIDLDAMVLRKGAISAREGERVLIPMNMRDGSLICVGKGNEDWNWSAPHGAGRIMSRSAARRRISLEAFEEAMRGVYSTTVNRSTVDESPFAYKPMAEIVANIGDTVEIVQAIKPVYNFKAADG